MIRILLSCSLLGVVVPAHAQTAPPPTVTRTLTSGSASLTVNFTLHPIRSPNFLVRVQDSTGAFATHTADVPRTYIGTVAGRPGAIAAGYQKANGTFLSHVILEDGNTWTSSGTSATASNVTWSPNVYPTTGVGSGGAGSQVRAAELGVDASYREYLAVGSNVPNLIEMVEWCVMKTNIIYLRDAAILHRLGRIVVRTGAPHCPYEAISSSDWGALLSTTRTQWNSVLPAGTHDVAVMIKPAVGGGLAYVGVIGTASRYSITGASSGDFTNVWRHEAGHNWGSSHFEGGGKPEGPTIMSDNSLARFSSPELARIISHRNARNSVLDNLGSYASPLPPRANADRITMGNGALTSVVDVLDNDSDSNGQTITIHSFDHSSTQRSLVVRSPGTGPSGRDQLVIYAPPNFTSGYGHFNYRVQDSAGYQGVSKVYVNPVKLPLMPPLWAAGDIGSTGAAGDQGGAEAAQVIYASGADIWGAADAFRFVRQPVQGDCDLRARVTGQAATNGYAKAGVMLRADTSAGSAHAALYATPENGFAFQYRSGSGGVTSHVQGPSLNAAPHNWVRLTRTGNQIVALVSADGTAWTQAGSATIAMPSAIHGGLAVTSHVANTLGGAAFDHVFLRDSNSSLVLLDDTFDVSPATIDNDAADPLDTRWTPSGGTLALAGDSTLGGGQALSFDATSSFASMYGSFAGRTLVSEGDILRLTFRFRLTQAATNSAAGLRFGLFNRTGDGYAAQIGTGGNTSWSLVKGTAGYGAGSTAGLAGAARFSLNDQAAHTARITLKRTLSGINLSLAIDGSELVASDSLPVTTCFDTVAIRNGNVTTDFRVDDIRVEALRSVTPAFVADPVLLPDAAAGYAYAADLTKRLVETASGFTFTKLSGASWLEVSPEGILSGTPAPSDTGTQSAVIRVTNELGETATATITLQVGNELPSLYWNGGAAWNQPSAWSTSSAAATPNPVSPPDSGQRAVFNISPLVSAQTVSLGGDATAYGLLGISGGTVALQGGGANRTLTLGPGGISTVGGSGALTIGSATTGQQVALNLTASQSWTNASSATVTINNNVTGSGIDLTTSGNIAFRAGAALDLGTGTLSHNSGTLELQNNINTIGNIHLNGGFVFARNASAVGTTGSITLGAAGGGAAATLNLSTATFVKPIILGSTTGQLTLGNYGFQSPVINSAITGSNHLTVSGTISTTTGNSSYTVTLGGPVNHSGNLTLRNTGAGENAGGVDNGTIAVTGAIGSNVRQLTVTNNSSSTGGAQKATLSNTANAWTGDTTVHPGALLQLGASNTIPDGAGKGNLTVNGTFDLLSHNETVNGLNGSGNLTATGAAGASTITVGAADASSTFSGVLQNGSRTLALAKTGNGTLVLSGANSHSGGASIPNNGGTLRITHPQALGTGAVAITKTGFSTGTLALDLTEENTITNTFSGFGSTTFSGETTIPCIHNLGGANTLTSPLTITGTGGNGLALRSDGGLLIIQGTVSQTVGTIRSLHLGGESDGLIQGDILTATGGFNLVKDGAGTWTLTGTNTYSSGTTINNGALVIGSGGITGTPGTGSITNHASLVIDRNNALTLTNPIGGTGSFTHAGAGTTTLTENCSYTGDTHINAGGLALNHPFLHDGSGLHLAADTLLTLNHNATDTIDGLFIDGFRQPAGTWGAPGSGAQHETHLIAGAGKLLVITGAASDPYAGWVALHGLGIPNSGPHGDYDGDGLINLLEYALGTDPKQHTQLPPVVLEGGLLTLTHTLNQSATDITLFAEWSDDLIRWSEEDIASEVLSEEHGISTLKLSLPTDGSPARFIRLRAARHEFFRCDCGGCRAGSDSPAPEP